jgi:hypothetical protein
MARSFASALLVVSLLGPAVAHAQARPPIAPAVLDMRVVFAGFGEDAVTAQDLDIEPVAMPARGRGLVGGLHLYPVRTGGFALGIGGEFMLARGAETPPDDEDPLTPEGVTIRRRLQSLSGQLSINFGHRDGWSYLTAGMGPMVFQTYAGDEAPEDPNRKMTINMGGGARWFLSRHVALNLDLRFYLSRPDVRVGDNPARERRRMIMMSAGFAFK